MKVEILHFLFCFFSCANINTSFWPCCQRENNTFEACCWNTNISMWWTNYLRGSLSLGHLDWTLCAPEIFYVSNQVCKSKLWQVFHFSAPLLATLKLHRAEATEETATRHSPPSLTLDSLRFLDMAQCKEQKLSLGHSGVLAGAE